MYTTQLAIVHKEQLAVTPIFHLGYTIQLCYNNTRQQRPCGNKSQYKIIQTIVCDYLRRGKILLVNWRCSDSNKLWYNSCFSNIKVVALVFTMRTQLLTCTVPHSSQPRVTTRVAYKINSYSCREFMLNVSTESDIR